MSKLKYAKKITILLLIILLFNVCCPKQSKAWDLDLRIEYTVLKLIYEAEHGILKLLNNIFVEEEAVTDYENTIYISPESIIKGKFAILDANIFKKIDTNGEYYDVSSTSTKISDAKNSLREVIAGWYYALRNLSIMALLTVLVYVAIRMNLTSVSQDKAKYKTMLKDWFIALCLIFAMHYIMIATLNISTLVSKAIGTSGQNVDIVNTESNIIAENLDKMWNDDIGGGTSDHDRENFSQEARDVIGHSLVLAGIIGYTIIFAFKYLKRMIMNIFLILLAPISCITYPIDKIGDGKAQAYNRWFQEFFYNIIIQPFHLLIYVVLVGTASELATQNCLYAIMCFAVMIPAEKFIREMFGFKDKLGSPLGAFATGAIGSQLLSKLKSSSGGSNNKHEGNNGDTELPPATKEVPLPTDGGSNSENGSNQEGENAQLDAGATGENSQLGEGAGATGENSQLGEGAGATGENSQLEEGEGTTGENAQQNVEENGESQSGESVNKTPGVLSRAGRAINDRTSQHYMRKYGTTKIRGKDGLAVKMAKRGINKAYHKSKDVGRKAIKGATTLAGAAALGAVGMMFGQGKAGMMAGAALGGKIGQGITNKTDKLATGAEGYANDIHNAVWQKDERNDRDKFKKNERNIQLARQNYRDRNGIAPLGNDLNEELDKMYDMQLHGIKQEQFNDTLGEYESNIANGMGEDEAMNTAMLSALQSQMYSAKDFRDVKTMQQAYENLANQGVSDDKIRDILNGAAKMRGVKTPPLPPRVQNSTIDVPVSSRLPDLSGALGLNSDNLTEQQVTDIQNVQIRLQEEGFSSSQISELAEKVAGSGSSSDEVITNFESQLNASIEFVENGDNRNVAEQIVKAETKNGEASKEQIDAELRDEFVLKSTFDVKNNKDVHAMRSLEVSQIDRTQKDVARDFARRNRGQLNNEAKMKTEKEKLIKQLTNGGSSAEKAKRDAENIINLAGVYTGENNSVQ